MKKLQEFEKNSLVLFCLLMGANICSYLFQVIVGNLMTVEDYGVVNTVIGIVALFTVPTTVISMVSARYTAIYAAQNNSTTITSILKLLFKFAIVVAVLLILIGAVGIQKITCLFKLDSVEYILGALAVAIINLFFSVMAGTLQGLKKFFEYGIQNILVAAGKLLLSIALILLNFRVYGVIYALFVGTLIAILYGMVHLKDYFIGIWKSDSLDVIDFKEFCKYAFTAVVSQGTIIIITNGDVLLTKIYFEEAVTGVYSSASVIGKISMYVSTAVVAALFPMVVEKNQKMENTCPLLKKALFYGGMTSLGSALGMNLLGKFVIVFLFGERYIEAIQFLPYVCIYVVPLTFITILMNYVLAIGEAKMFGISIFIGLLGIVGVSSVMHRSIEQMMFMCGIILSSIFILNWLWLLHDNRK